VQEGLSTIVAEINSDRIAVAQVKTAIKEALRNPTKQMRVTFDAEEPFLRRVKAMWNSFVSLYDACCPDADHEPFETIMEHLTEAFVKVRKTDYGRRDVDWIHPSYRDAGASEFYPNRNLGQLGSIEPDARLSSPPPGFVPRSNP
jgi:hypothetical protein